MKPLALTGLLLALAAAGAARAERPGISAAELLGLCEANTPGPRAACTGLLDGYINLYVLLGSKDPKMRLICPPGGMQGNQVRLLFLDWAKNRRDLAGMDIAAAVDRALRDSLPCGEAPKVR